MPEGQIQNNGTPSVVSNIKHGNPVSPLGSHFILFVGAKSTEGIKARLRETVYSDWY
jgi:hypothetical protein